MVLDARPQEETAEHEEARREQLELELDVHRGVRDPRGPRAAPLIDVDEEKRVREGNPREIAYSLWALIQGLAHVSIEQLRRFTPQPSQTPFVLRATQDYFQGLACR